MITKKIGTATLHNCDCMLILKDTPDDYYNLAIVDPPYGIKQDGEAGDNSTRKHGGRKAFEFKGWDKGIPDAKYFKELFRVSKNQIIWGANYFTPYIPPSMGWVIWDKGQNLKQSDAELAYSSFDRALKRLVLNRVELLLEKTIHPTQKPIKLYRWLLKNYAVKGDKILDTHMGSGNIIIAALEKHYDITACELDSDYFKAAYERIEDCYSVTGKHKKENPKGLFY